MNELHIRNFEISGSQTLHCAGCERAVELTLLRVPGVARAKADHRTQTIEVALLPGAAADPILAALEELGYRAHPCD